MNKNQINQILNYSLLILYIIVGFVPNLNAIDGRSIFIFMNTELGNNSLFDFKWGIFENSQKNF